MKISFRRLLACALAAVMLAGCGSKNSGPTEPVLPPEAGSEQSRPAQSRVLRVASDNSSNMNPFTTQALQNFYLCQLLYDPLFRIDEGYNTEPCLALSASMAVDQIAGEDGKYYEGAVCTLRLKPGVTFWDGSRFTAADVIYSLEQAKNCPYYAAGLSHVTWAEADPEDPLKMEIHLSRPDNFFLKSLTFPIIQNNTASYNQPGGCGRFLYEDNTRLIPNPDYEPVITNIEAIELVPVSDMSAAGYSIKTGTVDLVYSNLNEPWNRSLGNGFTPVQMSNMVYLGVNKSSGPMTDPALREIIYRLPDRAKLDSTIYLGQDTTAWMPFNPDQDDIADLAVVMPDRMDGREAARRLDELGYDRRDDKGYRTKNGAPLTLHILVNRENSQRVTLADGIAYSLGEVGIRAEVTELAFEEYLAAIAAENYDLFVGEIMVPFNMDIRPMTEGWNDTAYGALCSPTLQESIREFLRSGKGYEKTVSLFSVEIPFIPLFFRCGIVAYPLNFCSNIVATEQDIFYNIEDWVLS